MSNTPHLTNNYCFVYKTHHQSSLPTTNLIDFMIFKFAKKREFSLDDYGCETYTIKETHKAKIVCMELHECPLFPGSDVEGSLLKLVISEKCPFPCSLAAPYSSSPISHFTGSLLWIIH